MTAGQALRNYEPPWELMNLFSQLSTCGENYIGPIRFFLHAMPFDFGINEQQDCKEFIWHSHLICVYQIVYFSLPLHYCIARYNKF